jgi:hypothetical protein
MSPVDPLRLAAWLAGILHDLGIPYLVGGSVAASVVGEPRSTLDLDLMVDCDAAAARRLARALASSCYVDEENAVEAARSRGSFNAIHLATSMKIDFFFAEEDFAREAIRNGKSVSLDGVEVAFYSAEDLVIRKLHWFRPGGESSERQWRDVIGILRLNRRGLDRSRMLRLAAQAGVPDLLAKAEREIS